MKGRNQTVKLLTIEVAVIRKKVCRGVFELLFAFPSTEYCLPQIQQLISRCGYGNRIHFSSILSGEPTSSAQAFVKVGGHGLLGTSI